MTRINLIPVSELSNQHLIAEYRELPRIVNAWKNGKIKNYDGPETYCLGPGHVKFFYRRIEFLIRRHSEIILECLRRGFNLAKTGELLSSDEYEKLKLDNYQIFDWNPSKDEIDVSRNRIEEKLKKRTKFYKWTITMD